MIITLETGESREKIISELKKTIIEKGKKDLIFDDSSIGKTILDSAVNITTIIANISGLITPKNVVGTALVKLLDNAYKLAR